LKAEPVIKRTKSDAQTVILSTVHEKLFTQERHNQSITLQMDKYLYFLLLCILSSIPKTNSIKMEPNELSTHSVMGTEFKSSPLPIHSLREIAKNFLQEHA
jgi:hypothetical protein